MKSKLQKKKDNPRSTYWKNKADKAWGEWMHREYDSCAVCGRTSGKLDAHHLISRSIVATRHDKRNGIMLCANHHRLSSECSPHKGPIGFAQWLRKNREEQFNWVSDTYWTGGKPDYKAAYEQLTEG